MRGPDAFLLERDVVPRRIHRDDVESQRIDAELADDGLRLDVVPEGLVHLPTVRAGHPSVHEHLVVRGPVERHDAGRELGAEPTTSLVRSLDDPILRPPATKFVLAGRIAKARPARDPAVEPHVDGVRHPPHLAVALLARQDDTVDVGPVEVHSVHVALCLTQAVRRSDDRPMRALDAPPDRERDAPVALPRVAPVPASSVKRPRASTGEKAGRPSFRPSSKSSGPWPGAECTSPVYSATTVSDETTLWTHSPFTAFWYGSFVRRG